METIVRARVRERKKEPFYLNARAVKIKPFVKRTCCFSLTRYIIPCKANPSSQLLAFANFFPIFFLSIFLFCAQVKKSSGNYKKNCEV